MKSLFKFLVLQLIILLSLSFICTYAQSLTVEFNKPCYDLDDVVKMKICYDSDTSIAIEVWGPSNNLVWIHEESSFTAGCHEYSFKLQSTIPEGIYTAYVAVLNEVPQKFTFKVYRPRLEIVSISPSTIKGLPGTAVNLIINVSNKGASGNFILRLKRGVTTITEKSLYVNALSSTITYISLTLPSTSGVYTYTLEAYNVKYGVVDDSKSISVEVVRPTVTIAPTPPPPPVIVTTPPPPPITPTTTSPLIPGGIKSFIADLTDVTTPEGLTTRDVVIEIPEYRVKIEIPANTLIQYMGKPLRNLTITIMGVKPPSPATQVPVGPIINLGPSGTTFNKPITVQVPYSPGAVPEGMVVMLAYYDEVKKSWMPLPTISVDRVRGVVIGQVTHFTLFAAVAFRIVTPVTIVTTTTIPTVVTSPITTTVVTTTTTPITKTVTQTKTSITTSTVVRTTTKTTTVTSPPVTVTATKVSTVTETSTVTSPVTSVLTTTVTQKVPVVPAWVYPVIAVLIVLIVIALIIGYVVWGRRRV